MHLTHANKMTEQAQKLWGILMCQRKATMPIRSTVDASHTCKLNAQVGSKALGHLASAQGNDADTKRSRCISNMQIKCPLRAQCSEQNLKSTMPTGAHVSKLSLEDAHRLPFVTHISQDGLQFLFCALLFSGSGAQSCLGMMEHPA